MKRKQSEIGDGEKYRISIKLKAALTEGKETTALDLDMDLTVEELDFKQFTGAISQAVNDNGARRTKTPAKQVS